MKLTEDQLQKQLPTLSINEIAAQIKADWEKPYFGAVPYLDAMRDLSSIKDNYYADSGKSIVTYFLGNAQTWRGPTARLIKAELLGRVRTN